MAPKTWTIQELLKVTAEYLAKKQIDNPRLASEVLLAHQLGASRVELYLDFERPLQEEEINGFRELVKRRVNREPLQYITGRQEFWSLDLAVGPGVLIPRPETEILVETALKLIRENKVPNPGHCRILDLGTGSGAIALALAKELPDADIWATDFSAQALETAQANARKHGLGKKITFQQGDLWEPLAQAKPLFDLIVSNPPYVEEEELQSLAPEVRDHEPQEALNGRAGGLYYIERIIREGAGFLEPGGRLLLEMDPAQTDQALHLLQAVGFYDEPERVKDYSRRLRVVTARKKT